ncbi:tyrosine-type recombinase/integrase [Mycobacterium sp. M1]|uniref:Tyrosine-type recombinase/integrase n=2 Tax=Mycolicibacter acidiphilus TaxID=2835306 RepID=A0ABS5RMQ7_9MYCO|nr:tyrosine-type recombinase/integrase [Mycolicibacter acidiphilus]
MAWRAGRKPSPHTVAAWRQDVRAIADIVTGGRPAQMRPEDITKTVMREAFETYVPAHEAASVRRCWSTWNGLCTWLYAEGRIPGNPMQLVTRPSATKTVPKSLSHSTVQALIDAVMRDAGSKKKTVWAERDLAVLTTPLVTGMRASELVAANVGDVQIRSDGTALIRVKGKGRKERNVPVEATLLPILNAYLDSRAIRFPQGVRRKRGDPTTETGLSRWPATAPLFVGRDGERITRATLQSRIARAFKNAGGDAMPVPGAITHSLRHTYATELAHANVSIYTLMNLLGHESMTTSQRYVSAAGTETRSAAAQNPLYDMLPQQ